MKIILCSLLSCVLLLSGCCLRNEEVPSTPPSVSEPKTYESVDQRLCLLVKTGEGVAEMTLQTYLQGVLLAEMPADFPIEALKAQAIASRTFALLKADERKHPDAHVCTDSACCQGWLPEQGDERIRQAVEQTDGLVLTYEDQLIDATFFSCSGGRTEDAAAVWGSDIPYLQAVDSPGEENAPPYEQTLFFDKDSFCRRILERYPEAELTGPMEDWIGRITYTEGGGIDSLSVGGVELKGTELRSLFGLRSTRITLKTSEEGVGFSTLGYGHRVGMSQYGARAMAQAGSDYQQILLYYYQGAAICRLETDSA